MAREPTVCDSSSMMSVDDAVLIEQLREGEMAAFSRLVTRYQDRLLNVVWRMVSNWDDAQEITQEAFLRAFESLDSFQYRSGFYTWLFRIAVNLSISHRRKAARAVKLSLHGHDQDGEPMHQAARLVNRQEDEQADPQARVSSAEQHALATSALQKLDDSHRVVVILRDLEGLDYQEIASVLEVPVGTVKSRLHRARMQLRELLTPAIKGRKCRSSESQKHSRG